MNTGPVTTTCPRGLLAVCSLLLGMFFIDRLAFSATDLLAASPIGSDLPSLFWTGMVRLTEIVILLILFPATCLSITACTDPARARRQLGLGASLALVGAGVFFAADFCARRFCGLSLVAAFAGGGGPAAGCSPFTLGVDIVVAGLLGPFAEELFFRGLLLTALGACRQKLPQRLVADVAIAAIYALLHLPGRLDAGVKALAPLFFMWMGCALINSVLFTRTGSILAGFVLHGSANLTIRLLPLLAW